MQILIIGEFSGFAKHLKNGFRKLGHDVTIVQTGDNWKKLAGSDDIICRDKTWVFNGYPIHGSNRICALITNFRVRKELNKKCPNPDLVFIINYTFLRENVTQAGVSIRYIKACQRKGAKLIMSECGTSPAGKYCHPDYYKHANQSVSLTDKRYFFLLKYSEIIVPTAFCYYHDLQMFNAFHSFDTSKVCRCIPLPITLETDYRITPCDGRRIMIFHGIIRPLEKGTPFIQEAMERLQKEMPDRVECVCRGGMPYDEYVKLFDKIDILVDQAYNNGWGINAAIGAMKGKCVLVSSGPENEDIMGIPSIPFVQIGPDAEQIYQVLKGLVLNPSRIYSIKIESRRFVEKYCDSTVVAKRYLESVNL